MADDKIPMSLNSQSTPSAAVESSPGSCLRSEAILRRSPRTLNSFSSLSPDYRLKPPSCKKPKLETGSTSSDNVCFFPGDPIPTEEARKRWPWRYEEKVCSYNGDRRLDIQFKSAK